MTDLFADERLQFFLRNREDIKTWAAIEVEVAATTRELLWRAQPLIEERLTALDPEVHLGQRNEGQYERVFARYDRWPKTIGFALEWNRTVDPLGVNRPKVGVFWWADPPMLIEPRKRLPGLVDRAKLQALGYTIPLEGVWPVGARVTAPQNWWETPDAWLDGIADNIAAAWPLVAPKIDEALRGELGVSGG